MWTTTAEKGHAVESPTAWFGFPGQSGNFRLKEKPPLPFQATPAGTIRLESFVQHHQIHVPSSPRAASCQRLGTVACTFSFITLVIWNLEVYLF